MFTLFFSVPNRFIVQNKTDIDDELYFLISLFCKFGILSYEDCLPTPLIWSTHYSCEYENIPFVMIYDNDYQVISFAVYPKDSEHRSKVAEALAKLIDEEKMNVDCLPMPNEKE